MERGRPAGTNDGPLLLVTWDTKCQAKYLPLAARLLYGLTSEESFTRKLDSRSLFASTDESPLSKRLWNRVVLVMNCGARGHGWNPSSVPFSLYDLRWDSQSPSASRYGWDVNSYFMGCGFSKLTYNTCLKECLKCHKYYLLFSFLLLLPLFFSICILGLFWVMYVCICACFTKQESVTYYDGNNFEDVIKLWNQRHEASNCQQLQCGLCKRSWRRRQNSFSMSDFLSWSTCSAPGLLFFYSCDQLLSCGGLTILWLSSFENKYPHEFRLALAVAL